MLCQQQQQQQCGDVIGLRHVEITLRVLPMSVTSSAIFVKKIAKNVYKKTKNSLTMTNGKPEPMLMRRATALV